MDVCRLAEPRNSRVLLCSILYAFASASILALIHYIEYASMDAEAKA